MIVESPLLALDHVHRRNFLGLGLSAVPGLIGSEAIAAAGFDTSDSFANLRAYVKMLSTFAEQPVFSAYIGQCFARIGDTLTPLFGYGGYVLSQARLAANKQIEMRGKEVALYIDHKTGEVLETWDNPFTHERVPVFHMLNPGFYSKLGAQWPAANFVGAADNKLTALWEIDLSTIQSSAGMSAGATLTKPFLLPWTKAGKSYATSMMMSVKKENPVSPAKWPKASTGPTIENHETTVLYADASALDDPDQPMAMTTGSLTRYCPWPPFMRMGQSGIIGGLVVSCYLYKLGSDSSDLPSGVRRYIEKRHPEMLKPYDAWAPLPGELMTGWTYYAKNAPPEVK